MIEVARPASVPPYERRQEKMGVLHRPKGRSTSASQQGLAEMALFRTTAEPETRYPEPNSFQE